jgi:hypothetical protein
MYHWTHNVVEKEEVHGWGTEWVERCTRCGANFTIDLDETCPNYQRPVWRPPRVADPSR